MTRIIEIRRHSFTKKGESRGKGSHLSAEGVIQARRERETLPAFDLVLTSQIPRTLETALAMGFAVDDQIAGLGEIPLEVWEEIGHHERWEWEEPFAQFAQIISRGGATDALGKLQREIWTNALESVPEDGRVLIISHGRIIESGLVTCFPNGDFKDWGGPFQHLEGIRMKYADGVFSAVEIARNSKYLLTHYPDYYDYYGIREDSFHSLTKYQLIRFIHDRIRNPIHQAIGLSELIKSELMPLASPDQQVFLELFKNSTTNIYNAWKMLDSWIKEDSK